MLTVHDCWPEKGAAGGFWWADERHAEEPANYPAPIPVRFAGRIRGFVGESGLRATCPDCKRFLARGECRLHGKVSAPRWVLKVKCRVALHDLEVVEGGPGGPEQDTARPWAGEHLWTGRDGDDTALLVLWGSATQPSGTPGIPDFIKRQAKMSEEMRALSWAHRLAYGAMDPTVVGERLEHDLMANGARIKGGRAWLVPVTDTCLWNLPDPNDHGPIEGRRTWVLVMGEAFTATTAELRGKG